MSEKAGIVPAPSSPGAGTRRILHLTLHRRWFDEIAAGRKVEEYRLRKPYWERRLEDQQYDEIHFRNGYSKGAPWMRVEWRGCLAAWGGGLLPADYQNQRIFAIQLGRILEICNYSAPEAESPRPAERSEAAPDPFLPNPLLHGEPR